MQNEDLQEAMQKRSFAITIGDMAGIGPEIILKAVGHLPSTERSNWIIHADPWMLERWATRLSLPLPPLRYEPLGISATTDLTPEFCAEIAWKSLLSASRALNAKDCHGVVTAPISKERMACIGFPYPGHTEFFAAQSKTSTFRMMFVGGSLRIILETIHLPLSQVPATLSTIHFHETLALADHVLKTKFNIASPKIAVCGLNPHAGENGLLGTEEKDILLPEIAHFPTVSGPFASDAYFGTRAYEHYDATICMYHDQALIPFKLLHFDDGVNATIGLPYLRTSPDHGCAFDIAGKGIAREGSFLAAMRLLQSLTD